MAEYINCDKNWEFLHPGEFPTTVTLPHCAFIESGDFSPAHTGTVRYRYQFNAPEEWKKKVVYFQIGAAMQKAEIYLNGVYQFTHFGGYQRFLIPLSDYIVYGANNVLEIDLDNTPTHDVPPGKNFTCIDFSYYSGLYRDAGILIWNPLHVTDPLAVSVAAGGGVFIRTEKLNPDDSAEVSFQCHVLNEFPAPMRFSLLQFNSTEKNAVLKAKIYDSNGEEVFSYESPAENLRPNEDFNFRFSHVFHKPQLWSPATPVRYKAVFSVFNNGELTDEKVEYFGIRSIDFRFDGFYLNGKKTFLNGTNRHMDYPFIGNATSANAQRREAMLLKKCGLNFVRQSHYTQHDAFIDACDELGIMVMPAVPGWQAFHSNSSFYVNAFRDCREMIRNLRNHPSIVLWETSLNETYPPNWVNAELQRIGHEEYPGKMCFTAGDTWGFYEKWDVLFPCEHQRSTDRPMLLREYGDWCFGGGDSTSRAGRGVTLKAQLVQAWNFIWTFNRARAVPGMIGCADWCCFDYRRGFFPPVEESGSFDLYRLPKLKAWFYRSQSEFEKVLYPVSDPANKRIIVFSNYDEVEILMNGVSIARQKPDDGPDTPYSDDGSPGWETALPGGDISGGHPFDGGNARHIPHPPFTFFDVPNFTAKDTVEVVAYQNGEIAERTQIRIPGKVFRLETRVRDMGVPVSDNDTVFVDAIVYDENGTVVPERHRVKLEVKGDADLIGGMAETEAGIASWVIRTRGTDFTCNAEFAE